MDKPCKLGSGGGTEYNTRQLIDRPIEVFLGIDRFFFIYEPFVMLQLSIIV